jgi:hypothetical protein
VVYFGQQLKHWLYLTMFLLAINTVAGTGTATGTGTGISISMKPSFVF